MLVTKTVLLVSALATGWAPTGFRWAQGDFPVPYCIVTNAQGTSMSQAAQRAEIELAIAQWVTSAAGGDSSCGFQATTASYTCNAAVSFNDNKNNIFFESQWPHGPSTLGVTHLGGFGNCGSVSGTSMTCFSNPDIEFNDANVTWRNNGSSTDLASIASHEYGHFIGLGHCNENGTCGPGGAIMYAAYTGGRWYTPSADDEAGNCAHYPPVTPGGQGYPCQNSNQCSGGRICVDPGTGGICTQTCGSCPSGYTCQTNPQNAGQQVCLRDDGTNKALCEPCRAGASNACANNGFCGFVGLPEQDVPRCVTPCPNPGGQDGGCPTNYGCFNTNQGQYCFPKSSDCTNLTNFTEVPFGGQCDGSVPCANGGDCIGICSQQCTGPGGQGSCPAGYACETFSFQQGDFNYCAPPASEGQVCAGITACLTGPCLSTGVGQNPICYQDCAGNPGACNNAQNCQTYNINGGGQVSICEPPGVPPNPPDAGFPDTGVTPDSGGPGQDAGVGEDAAAKDGGGSCLCDNDFCCSDNCPCDQECANNCQCDVTEACDPGCACDPECEPGCPGYVTAVPQGTLNGACYTNGTCNAGLTCNGGVCTIGGFCACDTDVCCTADCPCDAECANNCTCDRTTACDPNCACDPECNPGCPGARDIQPIQNCTCVSAKHEPAGWLALAAFGLLLVARRRMR